MALKKNIIAHYQLPRAGKERGSTKSATVVGTKLQYQTYYSIPIFPAFVDHGLYTSGNWYEHISYRLIAFEIPLEGNMRFHQRDITTVANPGTVYLMHRGENSRLEDAANWLYASEGHPWQRSWRIPDLPIMLPLMSQI